MHPEEWKFFGVTYGRYLTGDAKEENVKFLRLSKKATDKLVRMFAKETSRFTSREGYSYEDNPIYKPDLETDVFVIEGFDLPDEFADVNKGWYSCGDLTPDEMIPDRVKVVMGVRGSGKDQLFAFKKLDKSKILDKESTWFWWDENTYDTAEGPGFVMPEGLCAVYAGGNLYFNRDRDVNSFLDLSMFFREATRDELDRHIEDGILKWKGKKDFHKIVSNRCKRLMYMFMLSGGFDNDNITIDGVKQVAHEVGLTLEENTENGQRVLILPEGSKEITSLYEILTHHYSPGIWDGLWRRYNSSQIVPGQQP